MVDVAIVGGGIAGLSAALAAAERGASVLLLEAGPVAGGNARVSYGMFGGSRDRGLLQDYIPDGDPALQALFCEQYDDALAWLEQHGLPLGPPSGTDLYTVREMGLGEVGVRGPFLDRLVERVEAHGVELWLRARVARLAPGFAVEVEDGRHAEAASVVIATGGFAAAPDRLPGTLRLRALPLAGGDGLELAGVLGASTAGNMHAFYGHTMPDCELAPDDWLPLTVRFARDVLVVGPDGRRFVDEASSAFEETIPQAGALLPGGRYWVVFDARAATAEWIALARARGAPLFEAGSADELAAAIGLPRLADEVAAHTAGAPLGPPRSEPGLPIEAPPFYALRCAAGITATCGGIAVDGRCRALGERGPIPGLYAAGVDAGGVFGRTYGGFLAWSVVSGREAGRDAAS